MDANVISEVRKGKAANPGVQNRDELLPIRLMGLHTRCCCGYLLFTTREFR